MTGVQTCALPIYLLRKSIWTGRWVNNNYVIREGDVFQIIGKRVPKKNGGLYFVTLNMYSKFDDLTSYEQFLRSMFVNYQFDPTVITLEKFKELDNSKIMVVFKCDVKHCFINFKRRNLWLHKRRYTIKCYDPEREKSV